MKKLGPWAGEIIHGARRARRYGFATISILRWAVANCPGKMDLRSTAFCTSSPVHGFVPEFIEKSHADDSDVFGLLRYFWAHTIRERGPKRNAATPLSALSKAFQLSIATLAP